MLIVETPVWGISSQIPEKEKNQKYIRNVKMLENYFKSENENEL